jgi:hypothetical protein
MTTQPTKPSDAPISREDLYELVWSAPMLKVAPRFSVSSSYMARVCRLLNVRFAETTGTASAEMDKEAAATGGF